MMMARFRAETAHERRRQPDRSSGPSVRRRGGAALWVFGIVVTIIAAVRAHEGWRYRYPLTIRFL